MLRSVALCARASILRRAPRAMTFDTDQGHRPQYDIKHEYDTHRGEQRLKASDSESGHHPTDLQKKLLVWTLLYESEREIPEFVHASTMGRMYDRIRAVSYFLFVSSFFSLFFLNQAWKRHGGEEVPLAKKEETRLARHNEESEQLT